MHSAFICVNSELKLLSLRTVIPWTTLESLAFKFIIATSVPSRTCWCSSLQVVSNSSGKIFLMVTSSVLCHMISGHHPPFCACVNNCIPWLFLTLIQTLLFLFLYVCSAWLIQPSPCKCNHHEQISSYSPYKCLTCKSHQHLCLSVRVIFLQRSTGDHAHSPPQLYGRATQRNVIELIFHYPK